MRDRRSGVVASCSRMLFVPGVGPLMVTVSPEMSWLKLPSTLLVVTIRKLLDPSLAPAVSVMSPVPVAVTKLSTVMTPPALTTMFRLAAPGAMARVLPRIKSSASVMKIPPAERPLVLASSVTTWVSMRSALVPMAPLRASRSSIEAMMLSVPPVVLANEPACNVTVLLPKLTEASTSNAAL